MCLFVIVHPQRIYVFLPLLLYGLKTINNIYGYIHVVVSMHSRKIKINGGSSDDLDTAELDAWVQQTIVDAAATAADMDIYCDNYTILCRTIGIDPKVQWTGIHKLNTAMSGYRIVENVNELIRGRYIRWVSCASLGYAWESEGAFQPRITAGGFLTNITMGDSGVKLSWRSHSNRVGCILLDNCVIFQALTTDEKLITAVQSFL